jgi:photosystem II stability/assembly factor-like uncharacterized protein
VLRPVSLRSGQFRRLRRVTYGARRGNGRRPTTAGKVGFAPVSVTFTSAEVGWVLGVVPAGAGVRLAAAHTVDGGSTWAQLPAPQLAFGANATASDARIRFADPVDGWIAAPSTGSTSPFLTTLWSTHDGGRSWRQAAVPGGGRIAALEASSGAVHLVNFGSDGLHLQLHSTPAARNAWVPSPTTLPMGAGPVPAAELVLHGEAGWLVENGRTVVAGARLASGSWQRGTAPRWRRGREVPTAPTCQPQCPHRSCIDGAYTRSVFSRV